MNHLNRILTILTITLLFRVAHAQIPMSAGTYNQDFNTLANSPGGNTNWTDNAILLGWYASQKGAGAVTNYRISTGTSTTSSLYSFGASADNDRALGSMAGGTPSDFAFGVRFTNNTADVFTNLTVTVTGEQWRRANTSTQVLSFSYCVTGSAITSADAAGTVYPWIPFNNLDFSSPSVGSAAALDGNNATNRHAFSAVILSGVAVLPGQEIFLRWLDADDSGFDQGMGIDDLTFAFTNMNSAGTPSPIPLQIQVLGSTVVLTWANPAFDLQASGSVDGVYTNIPGASSPYTNQLSDSRKFFRLKAN
jgi:hypothetical protein